MMLKFIVIYFVKSYSCYVFVNLVLEIVVKIVFIKMQIVNVEKKEKE